MFKELRKLIETGIDISQGKWRKDANAIHAGSPYAKTTELIDVILETGQFDTIARHLIQMGADPKITESLHLNQRPWTSLNSSRIHIGAWGILLGIFFKNFIFLK